MLRDVRLVAPIGDPTRASSIGDHALVNRYGVERVEADLMLGFFFPGAVMDEPLAADAPDGAAPSLSVPGGPARRRARRRPLPTRRGRRTGLRCA